MKKSKATLILMAALGILAVLSNARADEWNPKTVFTFNVPS